MQRVLRFSAAALAAALAIYIVVSYGFDAVARQSVEQWRLENPAHAAAHHP